MNQIIRSYLDAHIKEYEIESFTPSAAFVKKIRKYVHLCLFIEDFLLTIGVTFAFRLSSQALCLLQCFFQSMARVPA